MLQCYIIEGECKVKGGVHGAGMEATFRKVSLELVSYKNSLILHTLHESYIVVCCNTKVEPTCS